MQKTKIAFFMYDMRVGGVETVLENTMDALLKTGADITFYVHRKIIEPSHIQWFEKHPQIKVVVYYPFARFFDNQNRKHPIRRALKRIGFDIYKKYRDLLMAPRVRAQKFDAIIDYISGYSARPLRRINNALKITWIHCSLNYFIEHNLISGLKQYDKIVTISDSFLKDFIKKYPEFKTRSVRIYNPVNTKDIQNKLKSAHTPDGKYFACVSRLDSDKDIPTVIYAFNKFYQENKKPDVKLYIIGDGEKHDEYVDMAKKTSASSQIIFTGKQSNPFGYMNGAMAHILSSFNEGLPTVLIESMAVKTINISSDCPSAPHEVLLDGDAGLLFKPGNTDELAQLLTNVYKNKINANKIIDNATKSLSRFDSVNIATQIIDLIQRAKK